MSLLGLEGYGSESGSEDDTCRKETQYKEENTTIEHTEVATQLPRLLPDTVDRSDKNELESDSIISLDPVTVERVKHYCELKASSGFDFTENIKGKKDFGNPQILHKRGSNYPKELWNPLDVCPGGYPEDIIYSRVERVSSSKVDKRSAEQETADRGEGAKRCRRSRWDNVQQDSMDMTGTIIR